MHDDHHDRTLSDAEHLMWRLEADAQLSSTFANVTILDRPPDVDRLRRRMEHVAERMPRLRRFVRTGVGNVAPATWVDDPDFDIDHHVRHIALPAPGSERQLFDLATLITIDPFDRTRPLWQFVVIDGLEGGRSALVEKLHHTIADGERGVELAFEFLDLERYPEDPVGDASVSGTRAEGGSGNADPTPPDPDLEQADAVRTALAGALRVPIGVLERVRELLAEPDQIQEATAAAADTFAGLLAQLGAVDRARSPLWTERSPRRHLAVASAPWAETRAAAQSLGGTINTAFLTVAADAAGRYHELLGSPVASLRASMAISTRTDVSGGNAFTLARLLVPTAPMPISDRFVAVEDVVRDVVAEATATPLDTMAALAAPLPTSILTRLARQQAQTIDFATSNVKGSPVPVYVAGARLLHNHPVGPLGGVPFNLTLLSYDGHLDMGINIDPAAVVEPELLEHCIVAAIADLTSIGG